MSLRSESKSSRPSVTRVWDRALRAAVELLTDDARLRVAYVVWRWLASADDASDLYSLAYALETARAMEVAIPPSIRDYVENYRKPPCDLPHLVSLIRSRQALGLSPQLPEIQEAIAAWVARGEQLADSPDRRAYIRFLLRVALELLSPDDAFIPSFASTDPGDRPSTTPTVAAQLVCKALAGMPSPAELTWLRRCHAPTGGWRASPGSPQADLVSTASALVALELAHAPPTPTEADLEFLAAHGTCDGGYGRVPGADTSDVESIWLVFVAAGSMLPASRRRGRKSPWTQILPP